MKTLVLAVIMVLTIVSFSYGATSIALTDNTLVTDVGALNCLAGDSIKELTITGTATDTAAVYCNGALIDTITLVATSEVWFWSFSCSTFKVDTTAVAGTPAATLTCK